MTWFQFLILFLLPLAAMFFCYSFVIKVLWKSTKELNKLTGQSDGNSCMQLQQLQKQQQQQNKRTKMVTMAITCPSAKNRNSGMTLMMTSEGAVNKRAKGSGDLKDSRKQVIKMLLVIISLFFLCFGPKWVINVLKKHQTENLFLGELIFFLGISADYLPFLHTCANPVIYCFLSSSFRKGLRLAFSGIINKCQSSGFCCCCGGRRRCNNNNNNNKCLSTNGCGCCCCFCNKVSTIEDEEYDSSCVMQTQYSTTLNNNNNNNNINNNNNLTQQQLLKLKNCEYSTVVRSDKDDDHNKIVHIDDDNDDVIVNNINKNDNNNNNNSNNNNNNDANMSTREKEAIVNIDHC
ncbi:hypothetical protein HELRODRAFT_176320 [Helobdella robusta]|uniref:G-protein coupled receptors family 1 profile domain-containing protein n=1 Tax=Helobdella robusta TaxID=6412 RepID=T1FAE0_HELRO|nr:hypothetical protein HELRODRAFT_176320 [Helobdella robusta]ESO00017.1 hypothetical protein HELRODRAFT_176320 [Helobdella robusta]